MLNTDYMSLTTFSFYLISNEDKEVALSLSLSFIPLRRLFYEIMEDAFVIKRLCPVIL